MLKNKLIITLLIVLISNYEAQSQLSNNSLFTLYNIGEMENSGFGQNSGMGGLSIGLRTKNEINYQNPAAYSSQDTLSFIFDIGAYQSFVNAKTQSQSQISNQFKLDHIAISIPLSRNWGTSIGIVPFSKVAYDIQNVSSSGNLPGTNNAKGSGNIYQIYFGNGYSLLNKKLSLGINLSYLFGNINYKNTTIPYNDTTSSSIYKNTVFSASDWFLNIGAQYSHFIEQDKKMIFGITLTTPKKIKTTTLNEIYYSYATTDYPYFIVDTAINGQTNNSYFNMPLQIGLGMSYSAKNYTIGADYKTSLWGNTNINTGASAKLNNGQNINNSHSIIVGGEITPNANSFRSYLARVNYRAGLFYNKTYWTIKGKNISDFGFSVGFGIPLKGADSKIHLAYTMGIRGYNSKILEEKYSKITVSFKFQELWFYQRKEN